MNAVQLFNNLDNAIVYRHNIRKIIRQAEKKGEKEVSLRLLKILKAYPSEKSFHIELESLINDSNKNNLGEIPFYDVNMSLQ